MCPIWSIYELPLRLNQWAHSLHISKIFLFISILSLDLKRCIWICIARIRFNYLIATFQNSFPKHCTTHLIENPPLTFTDIFDNFLHSSKVYVMCRGGDQIDLIGHDLRYQMKNNCAEWFVQFSFKSQWWWSKRMVVTQTRACEDVWSSFKVFLVFYFIMHVFDTDTESLSESILTESSSVSQIQVEPSLWLSIEVYDHVSQNILNKIE